MAPQVLSNITWVCATAGFLDDLAFIQAAAAAVTNSPEGLHGQVHVFVFACKATHLRANASTKHTIWG